MSKIITEHNCSVKDQDTIRPFARQGHFTVIDNFILDYIMPNVSPTEWKVLCFIIRKTVGWQKAEDKLSISQIKEGTGINSRTTISNAVSNLEKAGYILVHRPADQKTPNTYSLNSDYELVQKMDQVNGGASPKNGPELVQKMDTQNKGKQTNTNSIAGKPAGEQKAQKKKPNQPGPKKQLMDVFLKETYLTLPKNKKDAGYWWGRIGAILDIVDADVKTGKEMIERATFKLMQEKLSVSDPGSLVKTIAALVSEQKRDRPWQSPSIDNGQYVEVKPEETNGKSEMAVSEDWLTEQFNQARGDA